MTGVYGRYQPREGAPAVARPPREEIAALKEVRMPKRRRRLARKKLNRARRLAGLQPDQKKLAQMAAAD